MSDSDEAFPFISESEFMHAGTTSPDAMLSGDLPCIQRERWMKVNRCSRICVTQVSSPYKFWFQTETAVHKLKESMKGLSLMYSEENVNAFTIPLDCLKVGLVCAAIFKNQWHRAKIVEVIDKTSEVTVFYVDYGTTATISSYHLVYLHKDYADYPPQAIRGCLDMVRPTGGTWMYGSCKYFAKNVLQRGIYAKITSINEKANIFYMEMSQFSGEGKLVSLNELMIAKDFSYPVEKSINELEKRVYCDLYPTFDMLEAGKYPSMQLIRKWKKKGFDYHLFDQSVAPQFKSPKANENQ